MEVRLGSAVSWRGDAVGWSDRLARVLDPAVSSALETPVVLDAIVSYEKLRELLALQTEYPELDFKELIELDAPGGVVELAKDAGAMQVRGGYIVGGVDGHGKPTGRMDKIDARRFDEASLRPALLRYLPEPLVIRSCRLDHDGHVVVLIYIGRNPLGCAIFHTDGEYEKDGRKVVTFRKGDVFWRAGTSSERLSQHGLQEIIEHRVEAEKAAWLEEQQLIRRGEQADLQAAYESRRVAEAPLGALSFDLDAVALTAAALEAIRANDIIAVRHLLLDGLNRARSSITRGEIDTELADNLDKFACLASVFLTYDQPAWFERVVEILAEIYSLGYGDEDGRRLGYSSSINSTERAPQVWLAVIERVLAIGALAVRQHNWAAVRTLSLQRPEKLDTYYGSWLRHGLTMASRAQHLVEQKGDQKIQLSLLSLTRTIIDRLACLRPSDGLCPPQATTCSPFRIGLAQFDALSALAVIAAVRDVDDRSWYPNFARFRQDRVQPAFDRLIKNEEMRKILFPLGDTELAEALNAIAKQAHREAIMYDGFMGFDHTPVAEWLARNT